LYYKSIVIKIKKLKYSYKSKFIEINSIKNPIIHKFSLQIDIIFIKQVYNLSIL